MRRVPLVGSRAQWMQTQTLRTHAQKVRAANENGC